jgi:hypothetical protein
MTFVEKVRQAAGYKNASVALAALHALMEEAKTYQDHQDLAGYMEATTMRLLGKRPAEAE